LLFFFRPSGTKKKERNGKRNVLHADSKVVFKKHWRLNRATNPIT
jgi:hypothetical protein